MCSPISSPSLILFSCSFRLGSLLASALSLQSQASFELYDGLFETGGGSGVGLPVNDRLLVEGRTIFPCIRRVGYARVEARSVIGYQAISI
jgi:hypothetical protein